MSTTTPGLGLVKPDYTDNADISVHNSNMDKIDAALRDISCHVFPKVTQSMATITETPLVFDGELFDTDSMHDNSLNNTRITINTKGKYLFNAYCEFASNSNGTRKIYIRLNGSLFYDYTSTNASNIIRCSSVLNLNSGDYVELIVYQSSGSSLNVVNAFFSAVRVG